MKSFGISQNIIWNSLVAGLVSGIAITTSALAQSAHDLCPKGYSVFETVCLDEISGDVVNQLRPASKAEARPATPSALPTASTSSSAGTAKP